MQTDKPQTTTLEIVQVNSLGHEIEMRIPDVVRFKEVDNCIHVYAQGTWKYDTYTEIGKVICIKCGKEKP